MSNWSELAKEILWNVFSSFQSGSQCVSKTDLAQCALTCRFWRIPAQAVILSEINLRSESDLKNVTNIMFENSSLRNFVKTLKFVDDYHNKCSYTELLIIGCLFPNLKKLELYCDDYRLYTSFCRMLIEEKKFKNLEKLPDPVNKAQDVGYIYCLFNSNSYISSIKLIDHQAWDRNKLYQTLYHQLDRFPKSKHITVDTLKPINFKNVTEYLESITNNNSSTTLQKTVITSVDEVNFFSIRTTIGQSNTIVKTIAKTLHITMNEESFEMIPSKSFMQYIMRTYPSNDLDHFRFENIGLTYKRTSVLQSTFPTLVQFIDYICKVPNHYFKNIFLIIRCDAVPLVKAYYKHTLQNSEIKSIPSSLSLAYKS